MPALKKTPANSHAPEQQPEQQPEQRTEQQLRVTMLPAPALETIYANAFQTNYSHGEILLTACVSRNEQDQQGPVLAVQPQKAIGMSPESAKRLAAALVQTIQQYEAQYGEISL
ncbi:DUF3467 domain-containing protein [Desulfovibrio piger]|uniref:DUF3467 domain-containing protein n=1 Tax=Desulfovibrio piger TaxID=901 RepID=UPI002667082C|nr:DUF3467 domain-containing protein [Desulfovibrio piger]